MFGDNPVEATTTTSSTFQINKAILYVPVDTLSINHNIKFLENIKQGFRRTVSWNKYRSEITTQPKNNNLYYMTDPTLRNIKRLFVLSIKNGDDDPAKNSFDEYYMPLIEIKDFNAYMILYPFEKLVEMSRNNDYPTGNLLDSSYHQNYY